MMEWLTLSEVGYLERSLPLPPAMSERIGELRIDLSSVLDDDEIDSIRELLMDRLQDVGFDLEYQATEEGRLIERLIDKLFVG